MSLPPRREVSHKGNHNTRWYTMPQRQRVALSHFWKSSKLKSSDSFLPIKSDQKSQIHSFIKQYSLTYYRPDNILSMRRWGVGVGGVQEAMNEKEKPCLQRAWDVEVYGSSRCVPMWPQQGGEGIRSLESTCSGYSGQPPPSANWWPLSRNLGPVFQIWQLELLCKISQLLIIYN